MTPSASAASRTTVAVVGVGGVGGVTAGLLQAAGRHHVLACVKARAERLVVEWTDGAVEVPLHSSTSPDEVTPVDWVLLGTKVHDTPSTAPWLDRLCRPGTRIAVLQNGVGHRERLTPLAGGARVVPTIVYFNGERVSPERVRLGHARPYDLAVSDDADGHAFIELLAGTPLRVLSSGEFNALAWRKLLLNAVANPVTAITMQRLSVFERADIQALARMLLEEGVAVGRAEGVPLAPDEASRILAALLAYPAEAGTSMHFDRLAGRTMEVEALTGTIVSKGERLGVPTPLNAAVLALLRAMDAGRTPQPGVGREA